ncbi:MAG: response regulator transcription factor [Oscillospiraceae bacterium]|nr:response regulator transcription factor [Oscillospiraceae bacterium]
MFNILVVDDDKKMNEIYCSVLSYNAFHPFPAFDGQQALDIVAENQIDLVISDIMMPGMDGYALTEQLRADYPEMPILIISAKEKFEDKQRGFMMGTDDYMVKPVNLNEMILRVNALLRRAKIVHERKLVVGGTILNFDTYTVCFDGKEILVPQKEFLVLYKLISYPSQTFTRRQLMDEFWGYDTDSEERTVDVHINRLRERIKDCKDIKIETIRGLGYRGVKL